jgi:hypothetical protein
MFFYSGLTLLAMLISESFSLQLSVPLVWVLGWGLLIVAYTPLGVENLLANIPPLYSGFVALILLTLYLAELRIFVLQSARRFACS